MRRLGTRRLAPSARSGTASPLAPRLAGTTPALAPDEVEATETARANQGPWRVVVLNDPVNSMSYVVLVFRRVFGFAEPRARRHMLEVHEQGRSVVWSGLREQAELYAFALQQWHLTAILESDETH